MKQERSNIPRHVAVIMDGNGRWAKQKGLPRIKGHEEGAKSVRAVVRACRNAGVQYLTLYAFSIENWIRPESEIGGLMNLLVKFLKHDEHELHENKIRLHVIGRTEDLSDVVRKELTRVVEATKAYDDGHLILALSYGARAEIANAAKQIAKRVKAGELDPDNIDEDSVAAHLYAPDIPDPDLLIRTSGEMRVSNFLLWQISYTEFYVTEVLWPDFREQEFMKAIEEYGKRNRRYGDINTKG
ncbi:isoprenyl transferase [Verrucomicrobiota bacterium]